MVEIVQWAIKIMCFVGASWCAVEVVRFILTFEYREEFGKEAQDRHVNLFSYLVVVVGGSFPAVALVFIALNIHRLFQ